MSRLDKPRCVRTRHSSDVRPPSPGGRGKLLKRLFLVLLSLLQPVAGGILVLHLLGPLLLPDGESVGFLVVGGFLWGCHRSNCMFLSRFPTEAPGAFPGQGFPGAMQGSAGLIMLGCLGAVLYGVIPSAREPRRLLCALAALVWGLFGIFWHGMSGPERKKGRKKK